MATTNTEKVKPVSVEDAILADYEKGLNHYQLAEKHYGFKGEEAVERIRAIVEGKYQK